MIHIYGGLNEKPLPQAHGCEHFIPIWWGHLGRLGNIWVVDPCWGRMSRRVSSEGLWSCPTFSFLLSPPVFTPLSPLPSSSLNRKLPTPACGHAFPTMTDFYTSGPTSQNKLLPKLLFFGHFSTATTTCPSVPQGPWTLQGALYPPRSWVFRGYCIWSMRSSVAL